MSLSRSKEKLIGRLRSRRMRPREGLVLVEGLHTCAEAVDAGARVRFAVASESLAEGGEGRRIAERLEGAGIAVEWVDDETLASLSDTEAPQGILLVSEAPAEAPETLLSAPAGRFLLLDGVQDPGNLGTLVRAARAFALDGVVALDGTVDPWNPKAVRASAGASFRVPVLKAGWEDPVGPLLRERGVHLLVAEPGGEDVAGIRPSRPWALAIGSEARGPRAKVLEAAERAVEVPMPGGAESLNAGVAGAILLYALGRGDAP